MKSQLIEDPVPSAGTLDRAVLLYPRLLSLGFAVLCLSWGSTWLLAKYALAYTPPFLFVGIRALVGGLILWAACGFAAPPRMQLLWPGALLMTCVNFGLMGWGMVQVPSGLAATVNLATIPMVVLALSGHRPTFRQVLGLMIGASGLALAYVTSGAGANAEVSLGVLAIAAGAACYGVGTVLIKSAAPQEGPIKLAAWHSIVGGSLLLLLSEFTEPWTGQVWADLVMPWHLANLAVIVCLSTVVGSSIYLCLLRHWSAPAVASYAYICPIVALGLGALFGGEVLEERQLLACLVLIFAAAMSVSSAAKRGRPATTP